MKTEDFISQLAAQRPPAAPSRKNLVWVAAAGLGFAFLASVMLLGVRPHLFDFWPAASLKIAFCALIALATAPFVLRTTGPTLNIRGAAITLWAIVALAAATTLVGLAYTPPNWRLPLWLGAGVPPVLYHIPVIALPIGAALFVVARRFGPTLPHAAGFGLGAAGGALAAIPYSLACANDFAPYVATWYTASIAICAAIGGAVGARALRW